MKKESEGLGPPSAGSSVEHQKRTKRAVRHTLECDLSWAGFTAYCVDKGERHGPRECKCAVPAAHGRKP